MQQQKGCQRRGVDSLAGHERHLQWPACPSLRLSQLLLHGMDILKSQLVNSCAARRCRTLLCLSVFSSLHACAMLQQALTEEQ